MYIFAKEHSTPTQDYRERINIQAPQIGNKMLRRVKKRREIDGIALTMVPPPYEFGMYPDGPHRDV